MTIKAVIWDMGGVLIRTINPVPRTALAKRLGFTSQELEDIVFNSDSGRRAQLGSITLEDHWAQVQEILRIRSDEILAFQKEFFGGDRLDFELVEKIRSLKHRYHTGLLSNFFPGLRQTLKEQWQIADAFEEIVISSEVGLVKPDPRIFHLILGKLRVSPQEAVFVDDFIQNTDGATAIGMNTIHFRTPEQAWHELEKILEVIQ